MITSVGKSCLLFFFLFELNDTRKALSKSKKNSLIVSLIDFRSKNLFFKKESGLFLRKNTLFK